MNRTEAMATEVDYLPLSVRSSNCLKWGNFRTVEDVVRSTDTELLRLPNFGKFCLNEVRRAVRNFLVDAEDDGPEVKDDFLGWCLRNREALEALRKSAP